MRAYQLESFEGSGRLTDASEPEVGENDVLIRVRAASLNPHDEHVVSGAARAYVEYRFPMTIGTDFAGEVVEIGRSVSRFSPGQRVFGFHAGTFAERVSVPEDGAIAATGDGVDDVEAAALGLAGATALTCLDAIAVGEGDWVLVQGATGGVGSYLVQLARAAGTRVVATARSPQKAEYVRSLGAEHVVDPGNGSLASHVRDVAPGGVQGVIDLVNFDPEAFAALADAVLADGGRAVSTLNAADTSSGGAGTTTNVFAPPSGELVRRLRDKVDDGTLRVPVAEVLDLDNIEQAFAAIDAGPSGKVVLRIA
jgi:NADPH:quinone reductase-like Zn-dependent oxidoreductase